MTHPKEVQPAAAGECPRCGWPARPDDNFCEACRADLRAALPDGADLVTGPGMARQATGEDSVLAAGPGGTAAAGDSAGLSGPAAITAADTLVSGGAGRATTCPFCPGSPASADGYCESCGRKVPTDSDHSELDLGLLAGVTDRGLRHSRNEDAVALATVSLAAGPVAIAAVCDGVSGSPRPGDASQAAARTLIQVTIELLRAGAGPGAALTESVASARDAVAALVPRDGDAPAATFVGAVLTGDAVTLAWLGDSRGYWLGSGPGAVTERLTSDDSVAAEMVAAGLVSEADALALPQAHVVTRWIGGDLSEAQPHVARFEPPGPGVLLLCSDGLWNYQPDAAQLALLAMPGALADPLGTCAALVRFALEAGGADNVSVVLAPFPLRQPPGWRPPARGPGESAAFGARGGPSAASARQIDRGDR